MFQLFTYITDLFDERTNNYFFLSSAWPTFILVFLYLIIIYICLPMYMKNRNAFLLKEIIFYYNLFQIILNMYIVYLTWMSGYGTTYSIFKCRDVDTNESNPETQMAFKTLYVFFLSKFTEFFDTIFFILRKKDNQISFLHVYHHSSMPLNTYLTIKIMPGGTPTLAAGINAFIHVVMYTYYLLSSLGPNWQKYLWWKQYLTSLQLVQFIFGIWHTYLLFTGNCKIEKKLYPLCLYTIVYLISLVFLFQNFYSKCYNKERKNSDKEE